MRVLLLLAFAATACGGSGDGPETGTDGGNDGGAVGDSGGGDAGTPADTGTTPDTGTPNDAARTDAAPPGDAGGPVDGGGGDTGPGPDASTSMDASTAVDAGTGADAGTGIDAGPGVCGDNVRNVGEACDDGNQVDTDGCLSTCVPARCGDGIRRTDLAPGSRGYEECDDGNGVVVDGCLDGLSCTLARCGDGVVRRDIPAGQPGHEECDDGNTANGDGCDNLCRDEGTCGNGTVEGPETCDHGMNNDDETAGDCSTVCRTNCACPGCGDGVTDFPLGEECDDGNTASGDGCDGTCAIEVPPTCGDGILDPGPEECDDNNLVDGDGCDASCQLEPVGGILCGNGTVDPGTAEKCDPPEGTPADGDGCNATCNLTGEVTTLHTGTAASAITTDNTTLYVAVGNCQGAPACGIATIDMAACNASPNTPVCNPQPLVSSACICGGSTVVDDAPGTSGAATFGPVGSMTTDGTTLWFGGQHRLRALDLATGEVTTVAGDGTSCAAIDGVGLSARLHEVRALTYWNGNVYFLDGCENVLRRFDPVSKAVVTIAGRRNPDPGVTQSPPYTCSSSFTCQTGTPTEGYGVNIVFGSPRYMTADNAGNLFIIDTNGQAIWRYNTVTAYGEILLSGSAPGVNNALYSDGDSSMTNLGRPRGITSDGTSIYFAEQVYATVRQTVLGTLMTSTFVGAPGCTANQLAGVTARDGTGADNTQLWCRSGGGNPQPPGSIPILNAVFGTITYNYATKSIYMADTNRLRRIQ